MAGSDLQRVAAEAAEAAASGADPISIAIHLEEACDVVLPDEALSPDHLGSADAVLRTLRALGGTA